MSFLDTKNKQKHWFNRNYFYVSTILLIAVNILLLAVWGNNWEEFAGDVHISWGDFANLSNIYRSFLSNFSHSGWGHVIGNMICLAVIGIYLERKLGSVNFFLLVMADSFISAMFVTGNDLSISSHGFSGVNYCLYAYILLDYIFSLRPNKRDKTNIILGAVVIALIYVAMCCEEFDTFTFRVWPIDLLTNEAHYTSYFCGLILGLLIQLIGIFGDYNNVDAYGSATLSKRTRVTYLIVSAIFVAFIFAVPAYSTWRYNNIEYNINIDCSIDAYDMAVTFKYGEISKDSSLYDYKICSKWKEQAGLGDDARIVITKKYYVDSDGGNTVNFTSITNTLPITYLKNYQIYYEINLTFS